MSHLVARCRHLSQHFRELRLHIAVKADIDIGTIIGAIPNNCGEQHAITCLYGCGGVRACTRRPNGALQGHQRWRTACGKARPPHARSSQRPARLGGTTAGNRDESPRPTEPEKVARQWWRPMSPTEDATEDTRDPLDGNPNGSERTVLAADFASAGRSELRGAVRD
jgi:hypothetical protein